MLLHANDGDKSELHHIPVQETLLQLQESRRGTCSNVIPLETTIGNSEWLRENTGKIKNILPETWTHVRNLNVLQLGFNFKILGIDWRSQEEFAKVMIFLEKAKIMERNNLLIRRSPN
ncbi:MAG: hypothetical protein ACD_33C00046G0002 [uncultured bacterium]|nr:MAG: hypothetical protein ACD_33C00046G0002 [uncultured bacterium]